LDCFNVGNEYFKSELQHEASAVAAMSKWAKLLEPLTKFALNRFQGLRESTSHARQILEAARSLGDLKDLLGENKEITMLTKVCQDVVSAHACEGIKVEIQTVLERLQKACGLARAAVDGNLEDMPEVEPISDDEYKDVDDKLFSFSLEQLRPNIDCSHRLCKWARSVHQYNATDPPPLNFVKAGAHLTLSGIATINNSNMNSDACLHCMSGRVRSD
jgi:hypothetical protein